jgi:hypothetical protein
MGPGASSSPVRAHCFSVVCCGRQAYENTFLALSVQRHDRRQLFLPGISIVADQRHIKIVNEIETPWRDGQGVVLRSEVSGDQGTRSAQPSRLAALPGREVGDRSLE